MRNILLYVALIMPWVCWGEMYVRIGPDGRATVTNIAPREASTKPAEGPAAAPAPPKVEPARAVISSPAPAFPKVSPVEQKTRDQTRLQILEIELANEAKALAGAREKKDAEAVKRHENNVADLRREIAGIR
jgi:hypothetical protein